MKLSKITKFIPLALSLTALSVTTSYWASGTASGTDINNTAVLTYNVGGTTQAEIESSEGGNSTPGSGNGSATSFKVDKKIDLLVTAGSAVNVVPGTTAQDITFTLLNEGNSEETFSFSPTQVASGDDFDTSCATLANITLAADATATITVKCDIPISNGGTVKNGQTSIVDLKATTESVTETAGADDAATVQTVFADNTGTGTDGADRNAQHSAVNTYTINTADLTVQKTSAVTKMSINGADDITDPKRIPGATIEYTITVSNAAGASTAEGIVISDAIPATLSIVGTPTITGGTSTLASVSGQNVTSTAFDLTAGETAILTIITTVN